MGYSFGYTTVADPGFPGGVGANSGGESPTYYLANFATKLLEDEEILGKGRESLAPPESANTPSIIP